MSFVLTPATESRTTSVSQFSVTTLTELGWSAIGSVCLTITQQPAVERSWTSRIGAGFGPDLMRTLVIVPVVGTNPVRGSVGFDGRPVPHHEQLGRPWLTSTKLKFQSCWSAASQP